jgi:hypothetical protein
MDPARATWTDERLDDLARNVEVGFTRVHEDLRALGARMDARFDAVDRRFEANDRRLDTLQRLMIQLNGSVVVAVLATLLGVLITHG